MTYSRQHKKYLVRSPLRYPGSKAFLFDTVKYAFNGNIFIEAFAGSAILSLNFARLGKTIILNDLDPGLYAIWHVISDPSMAVELATMIRETEINMYVHKECVDVFNRERKPTLELAFSTIFINRTNFSGMLGAKVIGGSKQNGKYGMDVRFNREIIANRILRASKFLSGSIVYNHDALDLLNESGFLYLDPPYLDIDGRIYRYNYKIKDMQRLLDAIKERRDPWMLSHTPSDFINTELEEFYSTKIDHRYGINTPSEKGSIEMVWSNMPLPIQTTLMEVSQ